MNACHTYRINQGNRKQMILITTAWQFDKYVYKYWLRNMLLKREPFVAIF